MASSHVALVRRGPSALAEVFALALNALAIVQPLQQGPSTYPSANVSVSVDRIADSLSSVPARMVLCRWSRSLLCLSAGHFCRGHGVDWVLPLLAWDFYSWIWQ
jgi:hypothetical protein